MAQISKPSILFQIEDSMLMVILLKDTISHTLAKNHAVKTQKQTSNMYLALVAMNLQKVLFNLLLHSPINAKSMQPTLENMVAVSIYHPLSK
jgi:hypothetical protein